MKRSRAAMFLFLGTLALSLNAIGAANVQFGLAADVTPAPKSSFCPWKPRNPAPKPAPINFEDVLGVSHHGPVTYVERDYRGSSCDDFDCRPSAYHGGGCFEDATHCERAAARATLEQDALPIEEYDYGYDYEASLEGCGEFDCGECHPDNSRVGNLADVLSRVLTVVQDVAAQLNLENEGLSAAAKATGNPALELPPGEVDGGGFGAIETEDYDYEYDGGSRHGVVDNDGHADDLPALDLDFLCDAAEDDHPSDLPSAEGALRYSDLEYDATSGYAYDEDDYSYQHASDLPAGEDLSPGHPSDLPVANETIGSEDGYIVDNFEEISPAWENAENYAEEEYAAEHAADLPVGEDLPARNRSELRTDDVAVDAETGYIYNDVDEVSPDWTDENYSEEDFSTDHPLDLPLSEDLYPRYPSDLPVGEDLEEYGDCHAWDLPVGEDLTLREVRHEVVRPIYCPEEPAVDADVLRPALINVSSLLDVMSRGLSEMSVVVRDLAKPRVTPVSPIPNDDDPWYESIGRRQPQRGNRGL